LKYCNCNVQFTKTNMQCASTGFYCYNDIITMLKAWTFWLSVPSTHSMYCTLYIWTDLHQIPKIKNIKNATCECIALSMIGTCKCQYVTRNIYHHYTEFYFYFGIIIDQQISRQNILNTTKMIAGWIILTILLSL
jgi:hypothetical protein